MVPTEKTDFELIKKVLLENKRKHPRDDKRKDDENKQRKQNHNSRWQLDTHLISLQSKKKVDNADSFLLIIVFG